MAGYIEYEITTDPGELMDTALDNLMVRFVGYVPNEAHLETALVEETTRIVGEAVQVAADVPLEIFRTFGDKNMGIAPVAGARASMTAEFTAIDNAGYTVPLGTVVAFRTSAGIYLPFEVTADLVIPAGATQATGTVQALDEGPGQNGIAAGTTLELIDGLDFITQVVTTTASGGGADAETDDEYQNRLSEELRLMGPKPVIASEFATFARRVAGVHRAVGLDGYDPATDTFGNERMVAVAALDENGSPVGAATRATLQTFLEDTREANFLTPVFEPVLTRVDVTFTATALPGFDSAQVEIDAEQAVKDYLDPARWAGGAGDPPEWRLETRVRYLEVAAVLDQVPGLDVITQLTLGKNGGAQAAADVVLDGRAPLPRAADGTVGASTVDGTVT